MSRRVTATIRTSHDAPAVIRAALAPDNTDEMETVVDGDGVCTRIERETTGGAHATVDDYVVNLDVAATVVQHANDTRTSDATDASSTSTQQS